MRSIATALCLLLASVSFAQQPPAASTLRLPVQKVDFSEVNIGADRVTPLGEIYLVPPRVAFQCLIKLRMNFDDKLRESVHEM